jgi:hypothetical protein
LQIILQSAKVHLDKHPESKNEKGNKPNLKYNPQIIKAKPETKNGIISKLFIKNKFKLFKDNVPVAA